LLVADGTAERTLIDVVIQLASGPVNGLAEHGGIEEADAGYVLRSSGMGGGSENEDYNE
jgi:hypothetical protein